MSICADPASLKVVNDVSCLDPNLPGTITLGESFTFTPSGGGSCTSSSLTTSPAANADISGASCANEFTVEPKAVAVTTPMTFTYTFSGDIGNNRPCTFDVTVNPPAPSFKCSADPVTIGNNPSVKLTDIEWCDAGCTVLLKKGTTTLSGNGSTDGNNDYTVNFIDNVTEAGTVDYTVTLTSDKPSEEKTCSVVYNAAPPPAVCHCADYCGTGCENNITTGNVYHNNDNWSGCVFLTSATRINNNNGYSINGTAVTVNGNLCYDDAAACASKLAAYNTADGGWYFKIDKTFTDIKSSGYNPCATVTAPTITACPVASATIPPNGTVRITPTTTNCNVLGGCSFTILPGGTGDRQGTYYSGDITFKGESSPGGPVEYTISISNSADPTPKTCSFQVTYSASIAATEIPTSGNVSLSAGTHVIKCTSGKVVSCGHYINNDYSTYSMTIDDVSCPVAQQINWNRCQGISCTGGNQTLVTDRNITCQAL